MIAAFICRGLGWERNSRTWNEQTKSLNSIQTRSSFLFLILARQLQTRWPFHLGVPSREGLIRNRYSGRTFIEGNRARKAKASIKYTPLREVLDGKRVILVEDSIVRSTTMKVLLDRIRTLGGAKEIHVRVACPPIIAPCFYGIDMSTIGELFAPKFLPDFRLSEEGQVEMAKSLGCDSLRYLPVESIARAIDLPPDHLCRACITGNYPTAHGKKLYSIALGKSLNGQVRPSNV